MWVVSGGDLEGWLELVPEGLHVEVERTVEPFLILLGGESADEAQAALLVREDARSGELPIGHQASRAGGSAAAP